MPQIFQDENGNTYTKISGDFEKIFDLGNMNSLINSNDEIAIMLRGHLILEEFLNLWATKITDTNDLFSDNFYTFKIKLSLAEKLGFRNDFVKCFDAINKLRNKLSHKIGYKISGSELESIKALVDNIGMDNLFYKCEQYYIGKEGILKSEKHSVIEDWQNMDNKNRFLVVICILFLKVIFWMQTEFINRNIKLQIT